MKRRTRQLVAFLAASVTLLSPLAFAQNTGVVHELFRAANYERTRQGLSPLRWDDALAKAAQAHARLMAERGSASHQFPGEPNLPARARAAGAQFSWLSEDVTQGADARAIHQSFMESPLHRANILDRDMNSVGIAAVARNGNFFVVEDFSKAQ